MTPNHARLLVVDDSKAIRQMIHDLLHDLGFIHIDEAPDGLMALHFIQRTPYDVVLTDWNMPFLTGIELLWAIRHSKDRANTAVLLFTGEVSPRRLVEALEAGANGFVSKPFETAVLCEKMLGIVGSLPPVTELVPWRRPRHPLHTAL